MAKNKKKAAPKKKIAAKSKAKKPAKKPAAKKVKAAKPKVATKKAKPTQAKPIAKISATPKKEKSNFKWSEVMTPLDDRLIVTIVSAEKRTPGGLYIPDTVESMEAHLKGQVVCVGRGHRDNKGKVRPLDVQAGDEVLFVSYAGDKIEFQGQSAYILRESEVVGILT